MSEIARTETTSHQHPARRIQSENPSYNDRIARANNVFDSIYGPPTPRHQDHAQAKMSPRRWQNHGDDLGLRPATETIFLRRRDVVEIHLPPKDLLVGDERTSEANRFSIPRNVLSALMPRAGAGVRRGQLDLETFFDRDILEDNPPHMLHRALQFIFRHLEEYSRTGELTIFSAAAQQIEDDPNRFTTVRYWGITMYALFVVLDNERGLGCSDLLLGPILGFLEMLFPDIQNLLGHPPVVVLFEAFTNIFQVTCRRDVDSVHRIWEGFDPEIQDELLWHLRPRRIVGDNVQHMYDAIRDPSRLLRN
ncbi:Fc.00g084830.m01.CDS01 [Cosmosporella sp. VM-42]